MPSGKDTGFGQIPAIREAADKRLQDSARDKRSQSTLDEVKRVADSAAAINDALGSLSGGTIKFDKNIARAVDNLYKSVELLKTLKIEGDTGLNQRLGELSQAVRSMDVRPVVRVPAPVVNVETPKIDLSPIENALKKSTPTKQEYELQNYKAQDMEDEESMQYVGFVNPEGQWYIVQNDVEGNKLRYKFGSKRYEVAWNKRTQHEYMIMSKAINAIRT